MDGERKLPVARRRSTPAIFRNIARTSLLFVILCCINVSLLLVSGTDSLPLAPRIVMFSLLMTVVALLWIHTFKTALAGYIDFLAKNWWTFPIAFLAVVFSFLTVSTTFTLVLLALQIPECTLMALIVFVLEAIPPIAISTVTIGMKAQAKMFSAAKNEPDPAGLVEGQTGAGLNALSRE